MRLPPRAAATLPPLCCRPSLHPALWLRAVWACSTAGRLLGWRVILARCIILSLQDSGRCWRRVWHGRRGRRHVAPAQRHEEQPQRASLRGRHRRELVMHTCFCSEFCRRGDRGGYVQQAWHCLPQCTRSGQPQRALLCGWMCEEAAAGPGTGSLACVLAEQGHMRAQPAKRRARGSAAHRSPHAPPPPPPRRPSGERRRASAAALRCGAACSPPLTARWWRCARRRTPGTASRRAHSPVSPLAASLLWGGVEAALS